MLTDSSIRGDNQSITFYLKRICNTLETDKIDSECFEERGARGKNPILHLVDHEYKHLEQHLEICIPKSHMNSPKNQSFLAEFKNSDHSPTHQEHNYLLQKIDEVYNEEAYESVKRELKSYADYVYNTYVDKINEVFNNENSYVNAEKDKIKMQHYVKYLNEKFNNYFKGPMRVAPSSYANTNPVEFVAECAANSRAQIYHKIKNAFEKISSKEPKLDEKDPLGTLETIRTALDNSDITGKEDLNKCFIELFSEKYIWGLAYRIIKSDKAKKMKLNATESTKLSATKEEIVKRYTEYFNKCTNFLNKVLGMPYKLADKRPLADLLSCLRENDGTKYGYTNAEITTLMDRVLSEMSSPHAPVKEAPPSEEELKFLKNWI